MDWQQVFSASMVGHGPRLLGITMHMNPGVVCANRHDGKVHRLRRFQFLEGIRISGVAAEDDPMTTRFDEITIKAPINVATHPRSPVRHFKSADFALF